MHLNSKKSTLLILGITALICSRAMFSFFNDPEGPNLLIVVGLALVLYVLSSAIYLYYLPAKQDEHKGILLPVFIQVILVAVLFFCLK